MGKKKINSGHLLVVTFPKNAVAVSYLSNFFRILQATLREVAKIQPDSEDRLSKSPRPVLYQTATSLDGSLILNMFFRETDSDQPIADFTTDVMSEFMTTLKGFLLGNAQTHLWEYAVPESKSTHDSPLESRLAFFVKEMKKLPGSYVMLGEEKIKFSLNGFEVD